MTQKQTVLQKMLKKQTAKLQKIPVKIKLLMQRKTQKLQMAKMKHPQITQTKAKHQMVTVMVRELRTEKHHLC